MTTDEVIEKIDRFIAVLEQRIAYWNEGYWQSALDKARAERERLCASQKRTR